MARNRKQPTRPPRPGTGESFELVDLGEPKYLIPMPEGGSVVGTRPAPRDDKKQAGGPKDAIETEGPPPGAAGPD